MKKVDNPEHWLLNCGGVRQKRRGEGDGGGRRADLANGDNFLILQMVTIFHHTAFWH